MARKTKQQEIDELKVKLQEAYDMLEKQDKLINGMNEDFGNSPYCRQLGQEIERYKSLYESEKQSKEKWKERYWEMQEKYRVLHEADQRRRNAGRKLHDEKWMKQYEKFCKLMESGKNMKEIMQQLEISQATYFRLKKFLKEQGQ